MKPVTLLSIAALALTTSTYAGDIAVIDAGSSGSRIHVYQIEQSSTNTLPTVTEIANAKVKPGLSSFAGDPQAAAESIENLISAAKIPTSDNNLSINLMATAGMRLVSPTAQKAIYSAITADLSKNTRFKIGFIGTIPGQKEGLYDWIAANYLSNTLQPGKTNGVLDMGGASTEAAYATNSSDNNAIAVTLGGNTFYVDSQSFLGMGQTEAMHQYTNDANCFPDGYPLPNGKSGTGHMTQCAADTTALVNDVHSVNTHEANIKTVATMPFIAISGYYYTASAIGINNSMTLNQLNAKATTFCDTNWATLQQQHPSDPYLPNYCFNASYINALLSHGYGFSNQRPIKLENTITKNGASYDVDWTLGAALDLSQNQS